MSSASSELPIAQLLEHRTLEIISSINKRTFEVLEKHTSSSFIDSFQPNANITILNKIDSVIASRRAIAAAFPKWSVDLSSVSSEVNEATGQAVVWVLVSSTGKPVGHRKETVSQMHWKRYADQGWLCTKHVGLSDVPRLFC